jgi:diguanylate cyclase (GGDEF)-like protein
VAASRPVDNGEMGTRREGTPEEQESLRLLFARVILAVALCLPLTLFTIHVVDQIQAERADVAIERRGLAETRLLLPLAADVFRLRVATYRPSAGVGAAGSIVRRTQADIDRVVALGSHPIASESGCPTFAEWHANYVRWLAKRPGPGAPSSVSLVGDAGCLADIVADATHVTADVDVANQDLISIAALSSPGMYGHVAASMALLEVADRHGLSPRDAIEAARSIGFVSRNRENIDGAVHEVAGFGIPSGSRLLSLDATASRALRGFESRYVAALEDSERRPGSGAEVDRLGLEAVEANVPLARVALDALDARLQAVDARLIARVRWNAAFGVLGIVFTIFAVSIVVRALSRWHASRLAFVALERDAYASKLALSDAERCLSLTEGQLHAVFDTADVGITILDEDRAHTHSNRRFAAMRATFPEIDRIARTYADAIFAGERTENISECQVSNDAGERLYVRVSLAGVNDGAACRYVIVTLADVTESKLFEERLARQALRDGLTDLANRRALRQSLESAVREGEPAFALFFIDLDHFKPINDRYGHAAGDSVLEIIASRLRAAVVSVLATARVGGDEFVVIAYGISERAPAEAIATRLVAAIEERISFGDGTVGVSASIGVTIQSGPERTAEAALAEADAAMYVAKRRGGGYAIDGALAHPFA